MTNYLKPKRWLTDEGIDSIREDMVAPGDVSVETWKKHTANLMAESETLREDDVRLRHIVSKAGLCPNCGKNANQYSFACHP